MTNYAFQSLFDFTRTTSGTFVGSNGLIQTTPASVNLFTWTQDFDNAAWNKNNATVTANVAVAPDGTSTADKLVENATNNIHRVSQVPTLTAVSHTATIYAKPAGRDWLYMANASLSQAAYFNVSTGVIGTIVGATTATITPVGNGWYRCSITSTPAAGAQNYSFYAANADGSFSYAGDGTSGLFLWGAQLEQAATATTYTRNNGGVYPARFDYDPATLQPKGILIEEQRVNLLVRSEEFDTASWGKVNLSTTANTTTAPSGAVTADSIIENTTVNAYHQTSQSFTSTAATTYSFSVFLKANGRDTATIMLGAGANFVFFAFNLATATVGTVQYAGSTWSNGTASITNFNNGWYRCVISGLVSNAASYAAVVEINEGANRQYTGNGTSGLFVWGAQLEAGAFATSYIPTVASQVTRAADQCSIVAPLFAPWYNQSEGTFVMDASPVNNGCYALSATDGTANEEIILRYASSGTAAVVRDGGTIQANFGTGVLTGKNALAYRVNDFAVSTNGGAAATDTSGTIPTNNQVSLGRALDGSLNINGHIRSIRYHPVRLADFQLQALTA